MAIYRLLPPEGTCTFRKIMCGRKWVGRVYQHADGTWRGALYKREQGQGATPAQAFDAAVAHHAGFVDASHLREHNSAIRRRNRHMRAAGRYAAEQALRGNYEPIFNALTRRNEND